jgi:beta-N-acetylhexosaminidase
MRFHGVVFTDDLQMAAISKRWGINEACVMSLEAGCDICLICRDSSAQKAAIGHVFQTVKAGKLSEQAVEAAFHRVTSLL